MSLIAFSGAVILLWLMASPSSGQVDEFFSGNKLPEICTAGGQGSDTGSMFCVGYISGVRDVLSPPPSKKSACLMTWCWLRYRLQLSISFGTAQSFATSVRLAS